MIGYASNTGTRRNLEALRQANWRILYTPENPTRREGLRHAVDNGAWGAFKRGELFNEAGFTDLLERHAKGADFVVVPDIVAGGLRSLEFSMAWLPRLSHVQTPLLAVQDGMMVGDVYPVLMAYPRLGIFLGGSTEWKLATMLLWGQLAAAAGRYYHVGRVNTARRIRLAEEAGADSFDGTSASRYCNTLPLLESARQQTNMFNPKRSF